MELTPRRVKQARTLTKLLTQSRLLQAASLRIIHNFSHGEWDNDFAFEPLDDGRGYIHGCGGNIKPGDHLILRHGSETIRYHVDDITQITGQPHGWIAQLSSYSP